MTSVSEISRERRRRADAERSIAAILDAATTVLGQSPAASVEQIASAAGVTRQTVYAHFPTREALLAAVIDRITTETAARLEAIDADRGPAMSALRRWLDTAWEILDRYPVLLIADATTAEPALRTPDQVTTPVRDEARTDDYERHLPIMDSLLRIIRRGQRSGEFDKKASPAWFVAAIIALGHAAGQEVAAGRMSYEAAGRAFRQSALRVVAATNPRH